MNNRKRWPTKEAAKEYAIKALDEGRLGLTFCAALDFLGWDPSKRKLFDFNLYADFLCAFGENYIKEEIKNLKWELDNNQYVESNNSHSYISDLEKYLKIAQEELKYFNKKRR